MEQNSIEVILNNDSKVILSSNTPDIQNLITEIVKNRNSINYNQISVNASWQSDFDKKGFETLIKDLVKDYINQLKIENEAYQLAIDSIKEKASK